jgi:hypothetical protein
LGRGKRLIQLGLLALAPDQIAVNLCHGALLMPSDQPAAWQPLLRSLHKYSDVADVCPEQVWLAEKTRSVLCAPRGCDRGRLLVYTGSEDARGDGDATRPAQA